MSHNLPQPHPAANALRAHLRALERGVADARTQRLGAASPPRSIGHANQGSALAGVIGATPAARPPSATYGAMTPQKPSVPSAPQAASNGKPRAARAKSAGDFGAFFDSIQKREAS